MLYSALYQHVSGFISKHIPRLSANAGGCFCAGNPGPINDHADPAAFCPSVHMSSRQPEQQRRNLMMQQLHTALAAVWPKQMLPPALEAKYRDTRARAWWKQDVAGYLACLSLFMVLYVLGTCYLEASAIRATSNPINVGTWHQSVLQSRMHAPAAAFNMAAVPDEVPGLADAEYADNMPASHVIRSATGSSVIDEPELSMLQHLLLARTSSAVNTLLSAASAKLSEFVPQLKQVWQRLPLLLLWRVWVMADMYLLVKGVTGLVGLTLALLNPDLYCRHNVRTALVVTYLVAPVVLIPLRLITCSHAASTPETLDQLAHSYTSGPWPWVYLQRCPMPSMAHSYELMVSCASGIVLVNTVLHPLPFGWQVLVSVGTWFSLAATGVLMKARYIWPAVASGAASDSLHVSSLPGVGLGWQQMGLVLLELVNSCLNGLLLAGFVPLAYAAWYSRRTRNGFLASLLDGGSSTAVGSGSGAGATGYSTPTHVNAANAAPGPLQPEQLQQKKEVQIASSSASRNFGRHCMQGSGSSNSSSSLLSLTARSSTGQPQLTCAAAPHLLGPGSAASCGSSHSTNSSCGLAPATPNCPEERAARAGIDLSAFGLPSNSTQAALAGQDIAATPPSGSSNVRTAAAGPHSATLGAFSAVAGALPSTYAASSAANTLVSSSTSSLSSISQAMHGQQRQHSGQPAAGASRAHAVAGCAAVGGNSGAPSLDLSLFAAPDVRVAPQTRSGGQQAVDRPGALYASPFETVIISLKLQRTVPAAASPAAASPAAAAGPDSPQQQSEGARGESRWQADLSPAPASDGGVAPAPAAAAASVSCAAIAAAPAATMGLGAARIGWAGAAGRGPASQQLSSAVETAVRSAVSSSQVQIVSTSVTSFPGCVHVVMAMCLCSAEDLLQLAEQTTRTQAPGAAVASMVRATVGASGTSGSVVNKSNGTTAPARANGANSLVAQVDWSRVMAGLQQDSAGVAAEGLELRYMLVQGAAADDNWYWQSPAAIGAAAATTIVNEKGIDAVPASAGSSAAGMTSVEIGMLGADSASSQAQNSVSQLTEAQSELARGMPAAAGRTSSNNSSSTSSSSRTGACRSGLGALTAGASRMIRSSRKLGRSSRSNSAWSVDNSASTAASSSAVPPTPDQIVPNAFTNRSIPMDVPSALAPFAAAAVNPCSGSSSSAQLRQSAQTVVLSSFVLPTDDGLMGDVSDGVMPALKLPASFAAVLADQSAALRVVIAAPAVGGYGINSAADGNCAAAAMGTQEGASASSGFLAVPAAAATAGTIVVDMLLSPTTNWPAVGEIPIQQLLPADSILLAKTYGPVLTINLLATPMTPVAASGGGAAAIAASGRSSRMVGECLLLQLPLLLLPTAVCEGLHELSKRMMADAGSYNEAYSDNLVPLVRDLATMLLGPEHAVLPSGNMAGNDTKQLAAAQQLMFGYLVQGVLGLLESQGLTDCVTIIKKMLGSELAEAASLAGSSNKAADPALNGAVAVLEQQAVARAMEEAAAARQQAQVAQATAAQAGAALNAAIEGLTALSAAASAATQQARRAEEMATAAARRAAAAEERSRRQRAVNNLLVQYNAGTLMHPNAPGVGIWGFLGSRRDNNDNNEAMGGPPEMPDNVAAHDVLFGFRDERLEVQYRQLKAIQCSGLDKAAFVLQMVRQAVYVWRIGRLLQMTAGSGLSLVLLCKYEAVILVPYLVFLLCPVFWVQHRNLCLCLSQIACGLTVGMITATEVYRNEWSQMLQDSGQQVLARPAMLLAWFYFVVPLLQQMTMPEQLTSCVSQFAQSFLVYRYIFKGTMELPSLLLGLLGWGTVSFGLCYAADALMRRQAVASARRAMLSNGSGNGTGHDQQAMAVVST